MATKSSKDRLPSLGRESKWMAPPAENGPCKLDSKQLEDSNRYSRPEKIQKFSWNSSSKKWVKADAMVQIAVGPFDRGYTRMVFKVKELNQGDSFNEYVCKVLDSKTLTGLIGPVTEEMYYADARCAIVAQEFARKYNDMDPPQKIEFCENFILRLMERPGKPIVAAEKMMHGPFVKHNNNNGAVLSSRMTPQAFSHFTYEESKGKLLVCDIQGCSNTYTDPQIHSKNNKFGLGNQGVKGFKKFLRTHTCGVICGLLGLPRYNRGTLGGRWTRDDIVQQLTQLKIPIPEKFGGPKRSSGRDEKSYEGLDADANIIVQETAEVVMGAEMRRSAKEHEGTTEEDIGTIDFRCESPEIYSEEESQEEDSDAESEEEATSDTDIIAEGVVVPSPRKLVERFRQHHHRSANGTHNDILSQLADSYVQCRPASPPSHTTQTVPAPALLAGEQGLRTSLREMEIENAQLKADLRKRDEQIAMLQERLAESHTREAQLRSEGSELRNRIETREKECYDMRSEMSTRRREHIEQILELRKDLASIERDVIAHEKSSSKPRPFAPSNTTNTGHGSQGADTSTVGVSAKDQVIFVTHC